MYIYIYTHINFEYPYEYIYIYLHAIRQKNIYIYLHVMAFGLLWLVDFVQRFSPLICSSFFLARIKKFGLQYPSLGRKIKIKKAHGKW